jgi:hypothetical protein
MPTVNITPLVSVDRGRYLRQNEAAIRRAAVTALDAPGKPEHIIQSAFNAVLYCEDIIARHEIAVTANRAANREHLATDHERFVAKAVQLKLRCLDQLCHHLGF